MYSKRPKPADRNPLPNKFVRVESKKIVIPNKDPVPKKSGPVNYLGKTHPTSKSTSATTQQKTYETIFHGVGKYVGSGKDVWAFVWLDDFDTPPAANDEGIKN